MNLGSVFMTGRYVSIGIGIGTGPGVIQDHYSPTMGRHRTTPLYNGHIGNGNSSHQPQFEAGSKPFVKQNQVNAIVCSFLFFFFFLLVDILHLSLMTLV